MSRFALLNNLYLTATNEQPSLIDRIFGLDGQLLADIVINLLVIFILFVLMSYLLFNPARKLMQARRDKIQDEMDFSAKEKADAIQLKKEYTAKLTGANQEVEGILSDARKRALKQEGIIVEEAKLEASRIIEQANKEAKLEKNRVKDEVKQEIINVASVMAARFVTESMDANKQAELIDETLNEMGEETWQR